jgi:hypothetical protein
MKRPQGEFEN